MIKFLKRLKAGSKLDDQSKQGAPEKRGVPPLVNIILLSILGVLVVFILIGTIYAFVRPDNSAPLFTLGNPKKTDLPLTQDDDIRVFSGLGRMRIPLSDSSVLILSISFPYSANDTAFTEELAVKIENLRGIAIDYFSALPPEKLIYIDEDAAKKEILKQYNNTLRLGRIAVIYFNDLLVIGDSNR